MLFKAWNLLFGIQLSTQLFNKACSSLQHSHGLPLAEALLAGASSCR